MTKGNEFLVPSKKVVNLNKMVDSIFDFPSKTLKTRSSPKGSSKNLDIQSVSNPFKQEKLSVSSAEMININWKNFGIIPQRFRNAARYIKRKIWEKGIQNANVYISYETLIKISNKLTISGSMGSDQISSETKIDWLLNHIVPETASWVSMQVDQNEVKFE